MAELVMWEIRTAGKGNWDVKAVQTRPELEAALADGWEPFAANYVKGNPKPFFVYHLRRCRR